VLACFSVLPCIAEQAPTPKVVDITASDGTVLKATYFAAANPGPGVLLLHQCNRQRKVWDDLARSMTAQGINVLTIDYRGFGESGGTPFERLSPEETRKLTTEIWPKDLDLAFQYLLSQAGVHREKIGVGGASCGVNNSVQLARRHPEIKALVLLSGGTNREGRMFLQSSPQIPVFTAGADDDAFGRVSQTVQWLYSVSANPSSGFVHYAEGKHGVEMFAAHPELPAIITRWFAAILMNKPGALPKTDGSRLSPSVMRVVQQIDEPGGAGKLEQDLISDRKKNPKATLFPEFLANLLGYERLQSGDTKSAVEIFHLNVVAYPDSANVYDSLGDAYLAYGQKDLALQNAKRALELLSKNTGGDEAERNAIRESAEQKVKQLTTAN